MDGNERISRLATRLLDHAEAGGTDQCGGLMAMPVSQYRDPARHAREMSAIFHKLPLFLGLSAELPDEGDYKARDMAGVPVLVCRSKGKARAFLNICRHRGIQLSENGCGHARKFTCPYHGWSFANDGRLIAIPQPDKFGATGDEDFNLIELPCEERAGVIFGALTPGVVLDLDAFYGDLLGDLEARGLKDWVLFEKREFQGPNWKLAYDGNLENYHFAVAHRDSLAPFFYQTSLSAYDYVGPHIRHASADVSIMDLRDIPEAERWKAEGLNYRITRLLFPNLAIAFGFDGVGQIQEVVPGREVGQNTTTLYQIARAPAETEAEVQKQREMGEFLFKVLLDEDVAMTTRAQQGASSAIGFDIVFGRNEPANQHFHRWIDHYLAGD